MARISTNNGTWFSTHVPVSPAGCRLYLHPNIDINPVAEVSYFRHLQCQSYYKERQISFVSLRVIRGLYLLPRMARISTNNGTWFSTHVPVSPAGCRLYLHPNIDINPVAEVSYFRHLQCQSYYKERQISFVSLRVIRGLYLLPRMARISTNNGTWFSTHVPVSPAGCRLYLHPNIDINPVAEVSHFRHLQCQSYYKERQISFVSLRVIRGLYFFFATNGTKFYDYRHLFLHPCSCILWP